MPAPGQRVAETVYGAFRLAKKAVADGKVDAGGPQRKHRLARIRHANTHSPRRVVAAAGHHQRFRHIPRLRDGRAQRTRHFTSFEQRRHVIAAQTAGGEHLIAPVAARHVHPHRSGGIGHIAGKLTGHAQT